MKGLKEYKYLNIRTGLCAVMLICSAVMFVFLRNRTMNQDTVAPYLSISEGAVEYTEGEDEQVLFQGISATDDVDGDVTGSIRIRNIYYSDESEYAIITYVAKDSSNNIGIVNRKVVYHRADIPAEPPMVESNTEIVNTESEENAEN